MTDFEIIEVQQGSPEWMEARAGCITASMFSTIRAKVQTLDEKQCLYVAAILQGEDQKHALEVSGYKAKPTAACVAEAIARKTLDVGEWSDASKNYAFRLACERIAGRNIDGDQFETFAMRRGRELEEACRRRHEQEIGCIVDLAGFVRTNDGRFGCSADSLIEPDGGAEYKCFYAPEKVRPILTADDWGDVMDQVQGCMWLTGRKWWDMCLYFPALSPVGKDFTRKRIERDDAYIEKLEADLVAFERLVSEWVALLSEKPAALRAA
jgi:hypothetical protein